VFEAEDFGDRLTPELREQERRLGEKIVERTKQRDGEARA
jgi:hypothetical protein